MLSKLRTSLLSLQSQLTMPYRRVRLRRMSLRGAAPIVVLFYHRVADWDLNPWSISRHDFVQHLDFIGKTHEWIDMAEVQRRVRCGESLRPAVHVTFDDGYAENCDFAIPELLRRQIPVTYFATLHHVLTGEAFAHDRQRGAPIKPNTIEEIRQLAVAGVEIGAHTRNHLDIAKIESAVLLRQEIVESAEYLSRAIEQRVRYFAFPFGLRDNITPAAIEQVREGGMEGFCSAYGGYNLPGRDWFHVRRIHGDPGLVRLRNWLSFDPRKLRNEPSIHYSLPSTGI